MSEYVKYNDEVYLVEEDFEWASKLRGLDSPVNNRSLTILKRKEVLEYFKTEFRKREWLLYIKNGNFILEGHYSFMGRLTIEKDKISNVEIDEIKNTVLGLIQEFQDWCQGG